MTDFGMLSRDGRCRTFDADGGGYARGEGVCAVILKRRSQAESEGDTIRSIVLGTATNHDGLKDGLTLPKEKAQEQLIRLTYKNAGLSTADTLYFEASTKLPIFSAKHFMLKLHRRTVPGRAQGTREKRKPSGMSLRLTALTPW